MDPVLAPPGTPFGVITDPLVVHDQKLAEYYLDRLLKRPDLVGKFRCPPNLCLMTWSNYAEKSLAERGFEALGIQTYVVLGREVKTWTHDLKISLTLEYLKSGQCTADIICWMDARDAVLLADPARLLTAFESFQTDILFSSTDWIAADLLPAQHFARSVAPAGCPTPFLCAGVLMAKRQALTDLLEKTMPLIGQGISAVTPTCDQAIFNVLQRDLRPTIAIDYWQHFALRAAINEPYLLAGDPPADRRWLHEQWWWQALAAAKQALIKLPAIFQRGHTPWTRAAARWAVSRRLRRIVVLGRERGEFQRAIRCLRQTPWFA